MESIDGYTHHHLLTGILERGHAPSHEQLAQRVGVSVEELKRSLERLHAERGLVLHPNTHNIWLAHPFALSPAATWVTTATHGFWAPCLWCGLGVAALAEGDVEVHSSFAGHHEPFLVRVTDQTITHAEAVVHFSLPPRLAWDNVHHFCATVLPFRRERDVGRVVPRPRFTARRHHERGPALATGEGLVRPLSRQGLAQG